MKHYIDIENARFEDIDLGNDVIRKSNVSAFEVGDHIVIQEKVDGSNASFTYEDGKLAAFSRKTELSYNNTLRGFWNWVQSLDAEEYEEDSQYIFFGEWIVSHKISYNQDAYNKFYFYDVYDKNNERWMSQSFVREMAEKHHLGYVHTIYDGPFISWEHCQQFMNVPVYGEQAEGRVVKNITKLNSPDCRNPFYLKLVNNSFKEISLQNHIKKVLDPQRIEERKNAEELMKQIVTQNRVEKMIHKMTDEGILPQNITPKDMGIVAKNLPKMIYEDCVKEEPEIVQAAGEFGGKICGSLTMQFARQMLLG